MWTKYPTHPVVRALGPEIIRCSNLVPSYPFRMLSQVYILRDKRAYKADRALIYSIISGVVFNCITQCPSSRGLGEIILYQTADGKTNIDVKLENETVWLTQAQMALLFEKDQSVIARHIRNAVVEGEIDESNMQKMHNTISKYKPTTVYNLDVIISVGYRVHSQRGVQFRRWANSVLKDYLIKGYAVKKDLVQQKYDDLKALVEVMGRY